MIKNWFQFNEGKNYSELYHSIWDRHYFDNDYIKIINGVVENGLKFNTNYQSKKYRDEGKFKFLKNDYFISTTRDKSTITKNKVTFVLDGEAISNRYKIEPFNLKGPVSHEFSKHVKSKYGSSDKYISRNKSIPSEVLSVMNIRHCAEEKIINDKEGFLNPKYIKEIILNKPSEELINFINEIDTKGIKISII